jgi:hypothetical protein
MQSIVEVKLAVIEQKIDDHIAVEEAWRAKADSKFDTLLAERFERAGAIKVGKAMVTVGTIAIALATCMVMYLK